MAARYARIACPSCGGTLDPSRRRPGSPLVCPYCGTSVEPVTGPGTSSSHAPSPRTGVSPVDRSRRLRAVVLAAVLLLVGGLALSLRRSPGSTDSSNAVSIPTSRDRLIDGAAYLAGAVEEADGTYDLFIFGRDGDAYRLYRIADDPRQIRWTTEPLGTSVNWRRLVTGAGQVFVTSDTRLTAVSLDDGTTSWTTSLVAEVPLVCATCLHVVDGRLVVLQKNGSLQAFDAATGALVWDRRLAGMPRELPLVGGRLAVRDDRAGVVELLDPRTGDVLHRLDASYRSGDHAIPATLRASDKVVYAPDGTRLYALLHQGRTLFLQTWDLETGRRLDHREVGMFRVDQDARHVLADGTLYVGVDTTLVALDLATAAATPLVADRDHRLLPLAVDDDRILLFAAPTWEPRRWMIWAVDRTTGARLWQYVPGATTLRTLYGHGDWDVYRAPDRLAIIQYLEDQDDQVLFETIDPRTGVSQVRTTVATGVSTLWDVDWAEDTVWIDVGVFIAVDTHTGATRYRLR